MPALRFDNRFVRELPADPEQGPRIRQVPGAAFSLVEPTPVRAPRTEAALEGRALDADVAGA